MGRGRGSGRSRSLRGVVGVWRGVEGPGGRERGFSQVTCSAGWQRCWSLWAGAAGGRGGGWARAGHQGGGRAAPRAHPPGGMEGAFSLRMRALVLAGLATTSTCGPEGKGASWREGRANAYGAPRSEGPRHGAPRNEGGVGGGARRAGGGAAQVDRAGVRACPRHGSTRQRSKLKLTESVVERAGRPFPHTGHVGHTGRHGRHLLAQPLPSPCPAPGRPHLAAGVGAPSLTRGTRAGMCGALLKNLNPEP